MAPTIPHTSTPYIEPFPPYLEAAPRTPNSLSVLSSAPSVSAPSDLGELSRSTVAQKSLSPAGGLSPKSKPPASSPRRSPVQLTGLAAQASTADLKRRKLEQTATDARQTSPNPAVEAMRKLMGGGNGTISKPSDAPAPGKLSEPMRQAAESMSLPEQPRTSHPHDTSFQASPASTSSFGTIESNGSKVTMTATADNASGNASHFVAEPAEMNQSSGGSSYASNHHLAVAAEDENKAFSYPGPPQPDQVQDSGPSRGMSLPGYGQDSPKSPGPSNKRHKCPYCATDFTRHHNLKSHLLTHSQEKPYVCQTCQARFRRLHDLKRHTKLHTGERPHVCDRCGRKFARGDALARHNKGPGGCAGRRSSFGGDDDLGDGGDGMDGVEYNGAEDDDDTDQGRRVSEPSRKRAHLDISGGDLNHRDLYRQHSSTYPPPQGRPPPGSGITTMGPPQVIHPGTNQDGSSGREGPSQTSPTSGYYGPGGQVFGQQNMIESPKPLSPGQPPDQHRLSAGDASMTSLRNRSPSLTTQFQQQQFGRGNGGRTPPQPANQFSSAQKQPTPVLPPLHGNSNTTRPSLQSSSVPAGMVHPPSAMAGGQGSNPGSLSSHGRSSGGSLRDIAGQDLGDLWNFVRSLDQRFSRMQDEYELRISRLQEEVIALKGQMSAAASYSSDMNQQRY